MRSAHRPLLTALCLMVASTPLLAATPAQVNATTENNAINDARSVALNLEADAVTSGGRYPRKVDDQYLAENGPQLSDGNTLAFYKRTKNKRFFTLCVAHETQGWARYSSKQGGIVASSPYETDCKTVRTEPTLEELISDLPLPLTQ